MANVFVNRLPVPRIYRNERIYGGNTSITKTNITQSGGTIHIESGRLTNLSSKNVVVYFVEKFTAIPTGWIKVYRMYELIPDSDKWVQKDVLYYHASDLFKNEYGFGLVIDDIEPLEGIIVEYLYKE